MFAIWYTTFAWNEYREYIIRRFQQLRGQTSDEPVPKSSEMSTHEDQTKPIMPTRQLPSSPISVRTQPQDIPKKAQPNPTVPASGSTAKITKNDEKLFKKQPTPPKLPDYSAAEFLAKEIDATYPSGNVARPSPSPPLPSAANRKFSPQFYDNERNGSSNGHKRKHFDKKSKSQANNMVSQEILDKLESEFKKLEASDSKSLLKKYLTREIFDNLKTKQTSFGSTLLDCIQSGLANHDSGVGIYAPDAEAYTVFGALFNPIIEDYHAGFKQTDKHPPKDFGDCDTLGNVDPTGEYVVSTRVRCGRSLQGYPFNPCLTEEQYKEMQDKVSSTLSSLEGELKGTYYPLTGMTKEVQQKLIDDHFLFKEGDRFLQAANACRFWPTGRGIYHNENKTFLVWCNEEDHLRIISMQMGGDLGQVYRRLTNAVNEIEKRIPFSHDDRLGFLTFCPTNLGTTIRASVHIKVPKLAANKAKLEEVAGKYNLQVRGTRGEHTEAEGGIYDISNKRRMGLTEYQAVKEMYDGINELIKIEKEL